MAGVLLVASFFLLQERSITTEKESVRQPEASIVFSRELSVHAQIADSRKERQRGLSGRDTLGEYEGLLFIHEESGTPAYWMKDMLLPIDILWIAGEMIVDISENLQPETPAKTLYRPQGSVDKVLEVNAGFVEKNAVKIGDKLDITLP